MKIEHLAIWVKDLDRMCRFYETYFGAAAGPLYENPQKGFKSRFLNFHGGARLELMVKNDMPEAARDHLAEYFGLAHFALSLGTAVATGLAAWLGGRLVYEHAVGVVHPIAQSSGIAYGVPVAVPPPSPVEVWAEVAEK